MPDRPPTVNAPRLTLLSAVHPEGIGYASGAEDGFVRLHYFNDTYFTLPDYVGNPAPDVDPRLIDAAVLAQATAKGNIE